jgi:uncharacterized protein
MDQCEPVGFECYNGDRVVQRHQYLIEQLELEAHPEGGYYKRVYESCARVTTKDHQDRACLSSIYYLLHGACYSSFHRLDADEQWHYYEGTTSLFLHMISPEGHYQIKQLNPKCQQYQMVVPAHYWFAAELQHKQASDFALVGCSVAPGFEFSQFELAERDALIEQFSQHGEVITMLS